jgi:hypothetical protein
MPRAVAAQPDSGDNFTTAVRKEEQRKEFSAKPEKPEKFLYENPFLAFMLHGRAAKLQCNFATGPETHAKRVS